MRVHLALLLMAGWLAALATGCGKSHELMRTPNLYRIEEQGAAVFDHLDEGLTGDSCTVVYATDRKLELGPRPRFGSRRDAELQVGECAVHFGPWKEVKAASIGERRRHDIELNYKVEPDSVLIRYPGKTTPDCTTQLHRLLRSHPSFAASGEVCIFVHGYNNSFEDAIDVSANLWHFSGRRAVPVAYSWPAGRGGLWGYFTDSESGDFTVYHLKQLLRDVASCPGVKKINLLAHSRGTDVSLTALRELCIEARAAGQDPKARWRLGEIILASPDIDGEVAQMRILREGVPDAADHVTIYVNRGDKALWLSSLVHGSISRLGFMDFRKLPESARELLTSQKNLTLIDSRVRTNFLGHNYFYTNPATSSDVMLILNGFAAPGEAGRPLLRVETAGVPDSGGGRLWRIEDNYPLLPRGFFDHSKPELDTPKVYQDPWYVKNGEAAVQWLLGIGDKLPLVGASPKVQPAATPVASHAAGG